MIVYQIINFVIYGIFYFSLAFWADDKELDGVPKDTTVFPRLDETYTLVNMYAITFVIIFYVVHIRREVRSAFFLNFENNPEERKLGWLMLHSVELTQLEEEPLHNTSTILHQTFGDLNVSGKMFATVLLPDYSQLYQLESQRGKLENRRLMFRSQPPTLSCFAPKRYLYEDAYLEKRAEINKKITEELAKPVVHAHTTFLAVDSMDTLRNGLRNTAPKFIQQYTSFPDPLIVVETNKNPFDNHHINHW